MSKRSDQTARMCWLIGGFCWSHIPHCWKSHVTAQLALRWKGEGREGYGSIVNTSYPKETYSFVFFQVGPDRQSPLTLWILACILTFQAGLEVSKFVRVFIYIRYLSMLAEKALASLRLCAADSSEPSLLDNVKSIKNLTCWFISCLNVIYNY